MDPRFPPADRELQQSLFITAEILRDTLVSGVERLQPNLPLDHPPRRAIPQHCTVPLPVDNAFLQQMMSMFVSTSLTINLGDPIHPTRIRVRVSVQERRAAEKIGRAHV